MSDCLQTRSHLRRSIVRRRKLPAQPQIASLAKRFQLLDRREIHHVTRHGAGIRRAVVDHVDEALRFGYGRQFVVEPLAAVDDDGEADEAILFSVGLGHFDLERFGDKGGCLAGGDDLDAEESAGALRRIDDDGAIPQEIFVDDDGDVREGFDHGGRVGVGVGHVVALEGSIESELAGDVAVELEIIFRYNY